MPGTTAEHALARPLDGDVRFRTSNSRGAVVIASGDHQWEASAEGNGAVDALFRAVDKALAGGPDRPSPPACLRRPRGRGGTRCRGAGHGDDRAADGRRRRPRRAAAKSAKVTSTNIIAASIEAYIDAINGLLAEEHWSGATESAGNRKRSRVSEPTARERRAQLDEEAGKIDTTDWFNR
jgi:hypothetical protein